MKISELITKLQELPPDADAFKLNGALIHPILTATACTVEIGDRKLFADPKPEIGQVIVYVS